MVSPSLIHCEVWGGRGDVFTKKAFHFGGGGINGGGMVFYMGGLMIRSCQGGGVLQNAFSSNLSTVNLKSTIL